MAEDAASVAEGPPSESLATALHLKRNLLVGLVVGGLFALVPYLVRVFELLGPFAGTRGFPLLGVGGWYLLLAFVLATTTAMLVAAVLTAGSLVRLALSAPPDVEE